MTKSSKLIATLGVVAGLGVAALPLGSVFAATTSGNVDVMVEVQPAIAMTISGNNDSGSYAAVDSYSELDSGTDPLTNGTIQEATASSSKISILPNSVSGAGKDATFKSTVTVYTNNQSGYKLFVKDTDGTNLALTSSTDSISAGTSLSAGTGAWGYFVKANANTATTGAGTTAPSSAGETTVTAITGSDVEIDSLATESAGTATEVYYGVSTKAAQDQGTYTNTITYTATTNS